MRNTTYTNTLPGDSWTFATPATAEELAIEREDAASQLRFLSFENWDGTFTCDGCIRAPICTLVYDLYNTDGDCLWEK